MAIYTLEFNRPVANLGLEAQADFRKKLHKDEGFSADGIKSLFKPYELLRSIIVSWPEVQAVLHSVNRQPNKNLLQDLAGFVMDNLPDSVDDELSPRTMPADVLYIPGKSKRRKPYNQGLFVAQVTPKVSQEDLRRYSDNRTVLTERQATQNGIEKYIREELELDPEVDINSLWREDGPTAGVMIANAGSWEELEKLRQANAVLAQDPDLLPENTDLEHVYASIKEFS